MSEETKEITDYKEKDSTQLHHKRKSGAARIATIVFFCFIASFFGSWVFLQTGLVTPRGDAITTESREKLVVQEGDAMADVAKKVSPSVVSVVTQSASRSSLYQSTGAGTGVIISKDGYILTNKHVVGNATKVKIVTNDGTTHDNVSVVGEDPSNDLAFLKINNISDLTPAQLGDSSQVATGQKVMTIGNALGEYQNSVTSGIISGKGRPVVAQDGQSDEQLDNLFQTDAAINPGNSGGPLLNLSGDVIGINTAIAEDAEGIGFAIPINAAKGLIKGVIAKGKIEKAYLGVRYVNLNAQLADELHTSVKKGAYVGDKTNEPGAVVMASPAEKAGIKEKDIITKVNNTQIDQDNGLALLLAQYAPGDKVTLTILRSGDTKTLDVTLGQFDQ